jgi:hypothetical protein
MTKLDLDAIKRIVSATEHAAASTADQVRRKWNNQCELYADKIVVNVHPVDNGETLLYTNPHEVSASLLYHLLVEEHGVDVVDATIDLENP